MFSKCCVTGLSRRVVFQEGWVWNSFENIGENFSQYELSSSLLYADGAVLKQEPLCKNLSEMRMLLRQRRI